MTGCHGDAYFWPQEHHQLVIVKNCWCFLIADQQEQLKDRNYTTVRPVKLFCSLHHFSILRNLNPMVFSLKLSLRKHSWLFSKCLKKYSVRKCVNCRVTINQIIASNKINNSIFLKSSKSIFYNRQR